MRRIAVILITCTVALQGCASIQEPPHRSKWEDTPPDTQCTDKTAAVWLVRGQQTVGTLIAVGGFLELAAAINLRTNPLLGIGLSYAGILMKADADEKYEEIDQCKEFKAHKAGR